MSIFCSFWIFLVIWHFPYRWSVLKLGWSFYAPILSRPHLSGLENGTGMHCGPNRLGFNVVVDGGMLWHSKAQYEDMVYPTQIIEFVKRSLGPNVISDIHGFQKARVSSIDPWVVKVINLSSDVSTWMVYFAPYFLCFAYYNRISCR